jgi:hypothetical protein
MDRAGESSSFDVTATEPPAPTAGCRRHRRMVTVGICLGATVGAAVGVTALAFAATSPSTTTPGATTPGGTTAPAPGGHAFGGRFHGGGFGGLGGGFGGPVVHGEYTVKGPNGYETIDTRSGTVAAVSNTSGSTWSLTVKSADGTSGTFTVGSSASVNGGESGIASVKVGDTVEVTATVSGGTSTATQVTDGTTLQTNGKSWMPTGPQMPSGAGQPAAPGSSSTT